MSTLTFDEVTIRKWLEALKTVSEALSTVVSNSYAQKVFSFIKSAAAQEWLVGMLLLILRQVAASEKPTDVQVFGALNK